MGDAARAPRPPPVTGVGEPEREMKGLTAGDARSSLPSSSGEDVRVEEYEESTISEVPSVFEAGAGASAGCGERGPFPEPGVN